MTDISRIALEIDKIAQEVHEDPFELFRAAQGHSTDKIQLEGDYAVEAVKELIQGCSDTDLVRIDRLVFGE